MSDIQTSNVRVVIVDADDGYFVNIIRGMNTPANTTNSAFCYTYWGALRKAKRVAEGLRMEVERDCLGRPIVHEITV